MTIKGSLHGAFPIVKRQKRAQNGAFSGIRGLYVKCLFSKSEKAHHCAERRHLTYFA